VAVATYSTDLSDISTCEVIGTWTELTGHTSGGAATVDGESYIQGSNCISQSTGTKTGIVCGLEYDHGSDMSGSMSAGDCFFFWQIYLAAANVETFVNGGLRVGVGSSAGNMKFWKTGGKDFGRYPYGGWQNFAVDPTYAADYTDGSPTSAYQFFGSIPNILAAVAKGNPHGVDAIRYGRGDLYVEYGESGNYGTFAGMASANDAQAARWGLFQAQGTGYLWKGLISFGTSSNAVDFRDSNVNITIEDTPRTYTSFNKIEIVNASSNVEWIGVNITALNASGLSIGTLEMVDNATINIDTCVFTDMSTFIFDTNAVVANSTFRRCDQVTQGGGDFDDCIFDSSTSSSGSLYVSNLDNVDNCSFTSDGSNHAMELSSAHAGNSYTLTGCTYTDYATVTGTTGNECIYNNSGGAVTINIDGGDTPTYRNGAGASTNIISAYTHTITGLEQNSEITYVTAGTSTELFHVENATTSDGDGKYQTTYSHSGGATVDVLIFHTEYKPDISNIIGITLPTVNATVKVQMFLDENYYNEP